MNRKRDLRVLGIQPERVRILNEQTGKDRPFVAYWMQASQRAECNHALEYAVHEANEQNRPLLVFFFLTKDYPEANERHYVFLLEGLKDLKTSLARRGVKLVVQADSPDEGAVRISSEASLIVTDRGYTRIQRLWRRRLAEKSRCPVVQVESDVIVPVETASPKEEYTAATFRPKIRKHLSDFLVPLKEHSVKKDSLDLSLDSLDVEDTEAVLNKLNPDRSVPGSPVYRGGYGEARRRLDGFLAGRIDAYDAARNDPVQEGTSLLSPYLHFGQISSLEVALAAAESRSAGAGAFLEELIVRRELAVNYVFYNAHYDRFDGLPDWARKTLGEHLSDKREYLYTARELERSETHDPYWNAAQNEMRRTGRMHGYMRMYWGKKILEWNRSPEEAFRIALHLNNAYELDGRDPNGFAGVAWCFGKHDRAWPERPVFGKVRYMNDRGLRRKFDADGYVRKIEALDLDRQSMDFENVKG